MIIITVCADKCCRMSGSYHVIQLFQQLINEEKLNSIVEVRAAYCAHELKDNEVAVKIDNKSYSVQPKNTRQFFRKEVMPRANDVQKYMILNFSSRPLQASK
ncbi:MAG: (2Fe-2S) ferredoxin domain-containing protein [Papillibacter sp.]|jgi:hypothetical protein|nr:(2Fe-2S) ferredoxin domain-containing protein [Papillibacter sp.]